MKPNQLDLKREYRLRFSPDQEYREAIWRVLIRTWFKGKLGSPEVILDLGAGWGEFINQFVAKERFAMDLNPDTSTKLAPEIVFLEQDCSERWQLPDNSLDLVFTSNFFEHLREKSLLDQTLSEAHRCLKPGGRIACLGPNIRYLPGSYWDFYDHFLPLSHHSLSEALLLRGFKICECVPRTLPYTMVGTRKPPLPMVSLYMNFPILWRFFGKQFLVIGEKTQSF